MTVRQTAEFDFSLPEPPEVFIGREKELDEILVNLEKGRNIVIYGFDGVGKKSLAAKAVQIYEEKNKRETEAQTNLKPPIFINLEDYVNSKDGFQMFESHNLFKNHSVFIIDNPFIHAPLVNGKYDFSASIDKSKEKEDWLKTSFLQFTQKAKIYLIPIILTTTTKLPFTQKDLRGHKFTEIHLNGFLINEAEEFLALRGINLTKVEFLALYEITFGIPSFLEHYSASLSTLKNVYNEAADLIKDDTQLTKAIKTMTSTKLLQHYLELFAEQSYMSTDPLERWFLQRFLGDLLILAKHHYKNKNYKTAFSIFTRIKIFAKEEGLIKILASTLLYLGHTYKQFGNNYQSRLAYKDALRMFKKLKDKSNIAETTASLAALEILQGRTTDARKHLTQARDYFENENKPKAVQKMDDLFGAADYVDGAQMVQGRSDGVLA